MTAAQLKASILDQAIRGKLVPQDPNDEPASALLARIAAEKAKSEKGKARRPAPTAPIAEDEKPFDLPVGWEWVRIGDLVSPLGGIWTGTKKPFENVAVIRATNFTKDCELSFDRIVRIDVEARKLENRTLRENDFIIEKSGGGENMPVGRVVRFNGCHEKCTFCNFTTLLRLVVADAQDPAFLHFCFKHVYVSGRTIPLQSNTTNLRNLDLTRYLNLLIPLPPLAEQKRIVAKVDELIPLVEEYGTAYERRRKLVAELPDKLRKSILQRAIEGKLVPQDPNDEPASELLAKIAAEKARLNKNGKTKKEKPLPPIAEDEKPFDLPNGWVWVRFGEIVDNCDGERIPLSKADREHLDKKYDYYGASGVIDKVDRYLFDKSLLLIGEDGANLLSRSTPIAFIAHGKYWVNNHAHVLDAISLDVLRYMELYINAISLAPYVTGTAQPKMNQEKMNSIVVPLPPLAEQKRIVAKVEELLADVEQLKKEMA